MLSFKPNRQHISFNSFLQKQQAFNHQIIEMTEILKKQANFDYFTLFLSRQHSLPHIFKFLILIHRLIMHKISDNGKLLEVLRNIKWFSSGEIEEILSNRLIRPYQLFLQKRIFSQMQVFEWKTDEENEVGVYKLINLLHAGTSFVNMIYTLGRYYKREWAVEFNVGLCMDLRAIYDNLNNNLPKEMPVKLLEQIQLLHQKLYIAFYNCYYHKKLKPLVPQWIKTDTTLMTPKKKSKIGSQSLKKKVSQQQSTIQSQKQSITNSQSIYLWSSSSLFNEQPEVGEFNQIERSNLEDGQQERGVEGLKTNEKRYQLINDMEKIVSMISLIQNDC